MRDIKRTESFAARVMNLGNPQELDNCILTAEKLLNTLNAEADALKTFQKERLLGLVAEKEALACELAQIVKAFDLSPWKTKKNGQEQSQPPGLTGNTEETSKEEHKRLSLLRQLLSEINRCNRRNHIFVQGSLNHWENLLTLCLPSTYAAGNDGQAFRQSIQTKGLALNREI